MATHTSVFHVRFDECASDGSARASTLLRYTVETAFAHSTREGFPLEWYDARGLYWLARRARLDLIQPVPYGATVAVTTEVIGFRRIWARRRNVIRDPAGEVRAEITMDWIFTDRTGQPARVVPEMERAFPGRSEPFRVERLDMGTVPPTAAGTDHLVTAHQLDPRAHMNTAAYLDLFDDALLAGGVDAQQRPAVYELEFLRQSLAGDVLTRMVWPAGTGWMMSVRALDGGQVANAIRRPSGLLPGRSFLPIV